MHQLFKFLTKNLIIPKTIETNETRPADTPRAAAIIPSFTLSMVFEIENIASNTETKRVAMVVNIRFKNSNMNIS